MQQADELKAQGEIGEAQVKWTLASGLDAAADLMDGLGLDEAASGAEQAAAAARASGVVDMLQASSWMTAASHWGEVARDLQHEAEAEGGALTAGNRVLTAQEQMDDVNLSKIEHMVAEVEKARSLAEMKTLEDQAEELDEAARDAADAAILAERAARNLGD
jgi:hypothetical protein